MAFSFKSYTNIGIHLLGWLLLGFLLLLYVPLSWDVKVPMIFWIWQSIVLFIMLALFYINARLVVPQTLVKGSMGAFFIWILGAVVFAQLVAYFYSSYTHVHERMAALLGDRPRKSYLLDIDIFIFATSLLVLAFSTSWAMLAHWQQAAQREKELERDKFIAELAMLKSQINPHFFFNSLNSIYSLTYIDVEGSRKALLTLSRMMRYLLYKTEEENTTILKELDFLKDYVTVMRLRATDKVKVILDIPDTIEDYVIAPMLLLPFVENAFKHGIDATGKTKIAIRLSQHDALLQLNVVNGITAVPANNHDEGGVGLVNTQRRLQLLYPEKHQLSTGINSEGNYEVNLQIDVAS